MTKKQAKAASAAKKASTAKSRRQAVPEQVQAQAHPGAEAKRTRTEAPSTTPSKPGPASKIDTVITLLRTRGGASIEAMMTATGWQAHSVRGAISGQVRKKLGLEVASDKVDGVRRYRIAK